MRRDKGYYRILNQETFLFGFLLLVIGLINPGIPDVRSNVCPENLTVKTYPVDIINVNFPDFRSFSVKHDVPIAPFPKKPSASHTGSPVPSDQCYFYEGHRSIAERSPEPALPVFTGIFMGYPLNAVSLISHIRFVRFSSWTGNCIKIRPPPVF